MAPEEGRNVRNKLITVILAVSFMINYIVLIEKTLHNKKSSMTLKK